MFYRMRVQSQEDLIDAASQLPLIIRERKKAKFTFIFITRTDLLTTDN